jgi:hypothetical protein
MACYFIYLEKRLINVKHQTNKLTHTKYFQVLDKYVLYNFPMRLLKIHCHQLIIMIDSYTILMTKHTFCITNPNILKNTPNYLKNREYMMLMFTLKIKSMNPNLLACGEHFWVEITKCWVGQFYMRRVSTPTFCWP